MTETYLEQLKPERFPSPGFVVDEAKLRSNVAILDEVQRRTGAKILMALKCFAMWDVFPIISRSGEGALYGCCASSPDEARLAREEFGGEVHAFAAAGSRKMTWWHCSKRSTMCCSIPSRSGNASRAWSKPRMPDARRPSNAASG